MKISLISFKSTYIFSTKENSFEAYDNAIEKIACEDDVAKIYEPVSLTPQAFVVANKGCDGIIEKCLLSQKVKYVKKSNNELLSEKSIKARVKVPNDDYPTPRYLLNPVYVDPKKFDRAFKKSAGQGFYIEPYYRMNENEKEHTDNVIEFFKSGLPIKLPEVFIKNNNGVPEIGFQDGRHRYAVMRDLGFKSIPLAMDRDSFMAAYETGLLKEDS